MESKDGIETELSEMFKSMNITKNKKIKDANIEAFYSKFFQEVLMIWKPSGLKDEYRPDYSNSKYGGFELKSKEITNLIRSTGWELIKQIGKKIISGDLNLTTVSLPLKIMVPLTILQTLALSMISYPIYFGLASICDDPLEKFKFVIVASLSPFHRSSFFLKPMNPVLGETFEMLWEDGSRVYLEQTSHHPPTSHYIMYGPEKSYVYSGYSNFSSNAGMNSLKLVTKGIRQVQFKDGTIIQYDFPMEIFSNSFWGALRQESDGDITYKDLTNGYQCKITFGSVKKKPSDFFESEIKLGNVVKSKVSGSYLSYIEFDGVRYWDLRENKILQAFDIENQPKSSSIYRQDRILLEKNRVDEGQKEKEKIENLQREYRKLRESYKKQRK